ncbi:MAG: phosphonate metabolism transcriptional regulator PhnF [Okeania sp. SIO2D1]|nr:phosphonate metabolism transcriptional regulator PhnF [Okeania sp. SIO2D1]
MTKPLYIQIANQIRDNINEGVYKIGDKLPTETQLAQHFQVNRHTLRRALASLKREGLIRVNQGRGTFVAGTPIFYPMGQNASYEEALLAQGRQSHCKLLRLLQTYADDKITNNLNVESGEPVALIERLNLADNQPIGLITSYFSLIRFPELLQQSYRVQPLTDVLKDTYGCEYIRQTTKISTCLVKVQEARLLHLPINHPIFRIESTHFDQEEQVIEFRISRLRGDLVELFFES